MRWVDTVLIDAPSAVVWRLTTEITRWPEYTPTMRRVVRLDAGPLGVGSSARVAQPGQTPAVWTVTRFEPPHEFTWQTRRFGLTMTGSHLVEPAADPTSARIDNGLADSAPAVGRCRNTLVLEVTGTGAALFSLVFGPLVRRSLRTENAGFRAAAGRQA